MIQYSFERYMEMPKVESKSDKKGAVPQFTISFDAGSLDKKPIPVDFGENQFLLCPDAYMIAEQLAKTAYLRHNKLGVAAALDLSKNEKNDEQIRLVMAMTLDGRATNIQVDTTRYTLPRGFSIDQFGCEADAHYQFWADLVKRAGSDPIACMERMISRAYQALINSDRAYSHTQMTARDDD